MILKMCASKLCFFEKTPAKEILDERTNEQKNEFRMFFFWQTKTKKSQFRKRLR